MTEVFRQRNAQRIVGSSILLLLIVAAGTILLLLHKNEFFSEKNVYYLQADQSQLRGLRKSMDVRILGEPVGTVTDISYVGSSNEVRLTMQVKVHEDDTKNVIWENSQVVVARSFGIGEPFLEIERGIDLLGAIVSNLLDQEANAIRIKGASARGVKIKRLVEGSPAEAIGLQQGDIIISFNGLPVNNLGELYGYMSRVARGSELLVGIHGREYPVPITARLVDPKQLETGGTIIQFQPEPDRLEELTNRLSLVQESIANVEKGVVETLGETNKNMADVLVPTLSQFMDTGKSFEQTSETVRNDTLQRVHETLAKIEASTNEFNISLSKIDKSTIIFNDRLDQIAESFNGLVVDRAGPAFDSFNQASKRLGDASGSLQKTSESIGSETSVAMKDLQRAAQTLNDVLDQSRGVIDVLQSEVNQLPGTAAKINRAARGANEVIDGVKDHWLLRRSVKRSQAKKAGTKKTGPLRSLFGH